MPDTRDRYRTVTVTLTRRQAEAVLSALHHADRWYEEVELSLGRLNRDESVARRLMEAGAGRLRDALNGGAR